MLLTPFLALLAATRQSPQLPGPTVAHKKGQVNPMTEDRLDAYWKRAQQEVYKSPEELQAQHDREKRRGNAPHVLIHGDRWRRVLALTFDDGPHPVYTDQLLAILKREHVPATFFVIGFMAEKYPDLVREESAAGHLVANHTFSHVTLTHLPTNEVRTEYRACSDVLYTILGKRPAFCRPPGGDYDGGVVQAALDEGLTTVLWTDDPGDYLNPGEAKIEKETLDKIFDGGIILLHDGIEETIKVLPQIIEYAKKKGYTFVTVDKLKSGPTASTPKSVPKITPVKRPK